MSKNNFNYFARAMAHVNRHCLKMFGVSVDDVGAGRIKMLGIASEIAGWLKEAGITHHRLTPELSKRINDRLNN